MSRAIVPAERRRTLAILLAVAALAPMVSAQREDDVGARVRYVASDDVEVVRDIVYARYGDRELRLDLYLPAERGSEPMPGIVAIRGGGWRIGDKEGFAAIASGLASRGLAVASIEYRASDEARFPAALHDTKAAVRWMRANAAVHGIDADALGAIGGSAGAHLVALLATTHRMDELDGEGGNPDVSNRIQAAVAMAVPSDLTTDFAGPAGSDAVSSLTVRFLGASYEDDPQQWALASPISHVHAKAAPVLLIHSRTDRTVPHGQSVRLHERYAQEAATAELVTIESAPHAFWNWTRWFEDTMDRAAAFFEGHLRRRSVSE